MRYEVSERLTTTVSKAVILDALETQFKKISRGTTRQKDVIQVKSIEASFGSINRSDTTAVSLRPLEGGFLLVADVHYRPSVAFWIIFIITLFSYVFWLIPIIFYLVQKKTVRTAIEEAFLRVKNEYSSGHQGAAPAPAAASSGAGSIDELEKLAGLLERGLITRDEFDTKKAQILGLQPRTAPPPVPKPEKTVQCPGCSKPIPVIHLRVGSNACPHCGEEFECE